MLNVLGSFSPLIPHIQTTAVACGSYLLSFVEYVPSFAIMSAADTVDGSLHTCNSTLMASPQISSELQAGKGWLQ